MSVSKEELLHIAKLSDLSISDDEIENYQKNLENILGYVKVLEKAPVDDCEESIGANDNYNVFRKDEIKTFENREGLLANAKEVERDMFKLPKVIQ